MALTAIPLNLVDNFVVSCWNKVHSTDPAKMADKYAAVDLLGM